MTNKPGALGRRSQVTAARTRSRLLDRAERLFARKGYRGVSVRELASAASVRPFTLQHHFGSKLGLYRAVLCRWDSELQRRVTRALESQRELSALVESVVDDLFDFLLEKRDWAVITARAALGEGLPRGVILEDRSWVAFMDDAVRARSLQGAKLDLGLLLITVEGVLYHHVLSAAHYRHLFGRDVTDPHLRLRTKRHIQRVILAVVGGGEAAPGRSAARLSRGKACES